MSNSDRPRLLSQSSADGQMIITEDGSPNSQEERMRKEQRDGVVEKSTQTEEQENDFELESENSDPLAMMC